MRIRKRNAVQMNARTPVGNELRGEAGVPGNAKPADKAELRGEKASCGEAQLSREEALRVEVKRQEDEDLPGNVQLQEKADLRRKAGLRWKNDKLHRSRVFGKPIPREQVLEYLRRTPELLYQYERMPEQMQKQFLDFCCGMSGLCVCYDPFFKHVFNAEIHPDRLSDFLSALIGEKVRVRRVLPNEGERLLGEGSLVIMDIVVELEDLSLGNVEVQKYPYPFPGPRAACYSSDLVLRQYSRAKSRTRGNFNYRKLRTVYTIVLLEKSGEEFHELPDRYIHRSSQVFDTGLKVDLLQKYIYIPLDVFRNILHNKDIDTELEAWLAFLAFDDPEHVWQIQNRFPRFRELYADMVDFRKNVKEVLGMFSEALAIMDKNTVKYMIEEQEKELKQSKKELKQSKKELAQKDDTIAKLSSELEALRAQLAEKS